MADPNVPYKRDGDENAWNKLIQDINEKAEECDLDPLEEVEECHRLSKTDIEEAQELLKQICEDNEFTDIKDLWSKEIIEELEDAAAADACCCEETDIMFPNLDTFETKGGFKLFFVVESGLGNGQVGWQTYDWAGWIMQERDPLVITPVDCGDDPAKEEREGGRGWVGKEFRYWELFLYDAEDSDSSHFTEPLTTGEVTDGYIQFEGEGDPIFLTTCGEPDDDGTVGLGENDPAWNFDYEVTRTGPGQWVINSKNSGFSSGPHTPTFFKTHGLLPLGVTSAPASIEVFEVSTITGFLRLKCEAPEPEPEI